MNINLSLLNQSTNERSVSRTPSGISASESETAMPPPVLDSSSGKRAKGKTPRAERILANLESFASYDQLNGGFIIVRERSYRKRKGSSAACRGAKGYRQIRISKQANYEAELLYEHTLVWLWHYGDFPVDRIDHKNQNRADNRIENLRASTAALNGKNTKRRIDNDSGYAGVVWHKQNSVWVSHVKVNGKKKHIGCFATAELAFKARVELIKAHPEWGYTENHIYAD